MISVILPALNEGQLLKRTVDGILPTLPAHGEIIVVDNGSTDGSTDGVDGGPVRLLKYDKPLGASRARNEGWRVANNDFIIFVDAHVDPVGDWWQPLISRFRNRNIGIVGAAIGMMDNPDYNPSTGQRLIADPVLRVEWLRDEPARQVAALGSGCFATRKGLLGALGGFDEGMPQQQYEDTELCVRFWLFGYECWIEPASRVDHFFRTQAPYETQIINVNYNLLRLAYLHFDEARLGRVIAGVRGRAEIGKALAKLMVDPQACERRLFLHRNRVFSDNWYFNRFRGECRV